MGRGCRRRPAMLSAWTASSGPAPLPAAKGEDYWWIIDYKTTHASNLDPAQALPGLRKLFAPQLEAYASLLRNLYGGDAPVLAGLYYPRFQLLDWWEI